MKPALPIIYLSPAERDLCEIFDFICKDAAAGAERFLLKFDKSVSRLGRFPLSGSIPRDLFLKQKGYRVLVVDNYLVFYKATKRRIVIYRILHGKRKYAFLL